MSAMFPKLSYFFVFTGFIHLSACAFSENESVKTSHTESCVNGVCTTRTETTTVTTGGTGVRVETGVGTGDVSSTVSVGSSGSGGGIQLNLCTTLSAPLSACDDAAGVSVMMPRHLGCTSTGAHAWSCQDTFSGGPPYPVVACSGPFSSSCTRIGQIY